MGLPSFAGAMVLALFLDFARRPSVKFAVRGCVAMHTSRGAVDAIVVVADEVVVVGGIELRIGEFASSSLIRSQ
jgi:hypothetical protein